MSRFPRGLVVAGIAAYATSAYAIYHVQRIRNAPEPPERVSDWRWQARVMHVYDRLERFDDAIGWDEFIMGINLKRRNALRDVHGHVLEVCGGTGRNLPYYRPGQVTQLTLSDASRTMLDAAREKQLHEYPRLKAEFKNWDSQQLPVADNTYDTVVDTFGLCSVPDPVKALREMERVAKPGAPIILLQHGRSRHGWLNTALDKTAEDHAQKWGCWWNREITDIVREAGLHVESCDTSLLDTTYLIRARKPLPAAPCSNRAGSGDTDQRDV